MLFGFLFMQQALTPLTHLLLKGPPGSSDAGCQTFGTARRKFLKPSI